MDLDIKREWTARLRSDQYTQGVGQLQRIGPNNEKTYCCLGVLCEIAVERGIIEPPHYVAGVVSPKLGVYDQHTQIPSEKVLQWAGISTSTADVLAGLNDGGSSFASIASYIDGRL